MNVMTIPERTYASKQFTNEELMTMFHGLKADYGNDFALMFLAMHLETMERCALLETRVAALEGKKR
jgi:hypothetical protein